MSDKHKITRQQIHGRASDKSFSRGENYYHTGSVTATVRRGDEIEARCHGSYPEPYRVSVKLDRSGIAAAHCNCEYDWGGDCKHIVAVLLTYLHEPDRFETRQPLQAALLNRNKEDLVDIITMMVNRYPDLQNIVDNPTPNEIASGVIPLDTLSFRQELRDAFGGYDHHDGYEYGDFTPGRTMNRIASIADRLAQRGDWLNAAKVYRTVLEEFAGMEEGYFYPHDDLYESLYHITSALEQCLAQPIIDKNDDERRAILYALLGVFLWDMYMGGYGLSDDIPELILRFIHREDIALIRERVEKARDQQQRRLKSNWGADTYAEFLTDLDMLDDIDEDTIISRLREEGSNYLLTAKLLEFDRLDEAIRVIRNDMNNAYERVRSLALLIEHHNQVEALQLAEEILADEYDHQLAGWLLGHYKAINDKEGQFRWQKRQMAERPNIQDYRELKTVAQSLGQWGELRPQIIHNLKTSQEFGVLTRVYLHDEEWKLAWDTLSKVKHRNHYERSLELEVADASRHALPEQAISIFIKHAHQYIDHRGRDNYQQAAVLLAKVQEAYDQLDEFETWEVLIARLRDEHKRLRALQDELNKAGL